LSNLVYKYRAYDARALEIIINRQLWLAEPSSLNDPFDCQVEYSQAFNHAISSLKISEKAIASFTEASVGAMEKLRVLSLSKSDVNPLLWAHYADSHNGFCLGFNPQEMQGWQNPQLRPQDVQYANQLPVLKFPSHILDSDFSDNPTHIRELIATLDKFLHNVAITKPKEWSVEEEMRIVTKHPMQGTSIKFLPNGLEEVTFGLNMSLDTQATIQSMFLAEHWHHVKFFKIKKSFGSFNLTKSPV
jgi:hypothetical protein